MKVNIAHPKNGSNLTIKATSHGIQRLTGLKILDKFDGKILEDKYSGCIFQINGGCDREGFPMSEKYLTDKRKRPILKAGDIGFRPKRKGMKKRKTVRGTIVSDEITMLNVSLIEQNDIEICGLTDKEVPVTRWPKRINKLKDRLEIPRSQKVTPEEIQEIVKKLVLERTEGENVKYPRIRVTRFNSKRKQARKAIRKAENAQKREKSKKLKEEYMAKYPEFLKTFKFN
ncbi:40S ribosomal protein S6 [Cucumispora dikerogammari]|nr:40S ribosomal protein S6 [Cucumispora dikerogammari]